MKIFIGGGGVEGSKSTDKFLENLHKMGILMGGGGAQVKAKIVVVTR